MILPRRVVLVALSRRHLRSWWRNGRVFVALLLMAFTWIARPDAPTAAAALWAGFFGAMLVGAILGGAILAQDYESGTMALQRLHGITAVELAIAALATLIVATVVAFAAWAGAVLIRVPNAVGSPLGIPLLACVLGLVAWCSLLVGAGSALPGYGNLAAATGLALFGSADGFGEVPVVSAVLTVLRDVLPLPRQAIAIVRQSEIGVSIAGDVLVLTLGSAALLAVTLLVLDRREPVSRWRR